MANNGSAATNEVTTLGKSGGRGPSYPAFSLEEAVDKAQKFWAAAKRGAAPAVAVAKHWGYSETSSTGKTAVAALLQFGLLQAEGALESRTVKLTGRGLDIVLDEPTSPRRWRALQDAVQSPKLYADILTKWPAHELPVDSMLRYYLIREKSFNEVSVDGFIKDFRASLAFAKLDMPATIEDVSDVEDELDSDSESMSAATIDQPKAALAASSRATLPAMQAPALPVASHHAPGVIDYMDDVYKLGDGRAFILRWPAAMSKEEFDEFSDWIALIQRKLKRSIPS